MSYLYSMQNLEEDAFTDPTKASDLERVETELKETTLENTNVSISLPDNTLTGMTGMEDLRASGELTEKPTDPLVNPGTQQPVEHNRQVYPESRPNGYLYTDPVDDLREFAAQECNEYMHDTAMRSLNSLNRLGDIYEALSKGEISTQRVLSDYDDDTHYLVSPAMEGKYSNAIGRAWDAVYEFFRRMWKYLVAFLRNITGDAVRLVRRADKIIIRCKDHSGSGSVSYNDEWRDLSIEGDVPANFPEVSDNIQTCVKIIEDLMASVKQWDSLYTSLLAMLDSFDAATKDMGNPRAAEKFRESVASYSRTLYETFQSIPQAHKDLKDRKDALVSVRSVEIVGNKSIVYEFPIDGLTKVNAGFSDYKDLETMSATMRRATVQLENTFSYNTPKRTENEVKYDTINEIEHLALTVKRVAKAGRDYQGLKFADKLDNDLHKLSTRASRLVNRLDSKDIDANSDEAKLWDEMTKWIIHTTKYVSAYHPKTIAQCYRSCRAAMSLAERALDNRPQE